MATTKRMTFTNLVGCRFLVTCLLWFLSISCQTSFRHCLCWALSVSSLGNPRQLLPSGQWIIKTKESFKLADLFVHEIHVWCDTVAGGTKDAHAITCRRKVLDAATGSSLVELAVNPSDDSTSSNIGFESPYLWSKEYSPSWLRERCDWIAKVLVTASSAEELVGAVHCASNQDDFGRHVVHPWTLSYLCMRSSDTLRQNKNQAAFTQSTMTCAVAQAIQSPKAALTPNSDDGPCDRLVILDVRDSVNNGFYLVRVLPLPSSSSSSSLDKAKTDYKQRWSQRPFPYSSAINPVVAEVLVEILSYQVQSHAFHSQHTGRRILLDPTCGSGTFLSLALSKGFDVIGWDSNPKCVEGCQQNLAYMLETLGNVSCGCIVDIQCRDSTIPHASLDEFVVDCVVCNLPWGQNSVHYVDESMKILQGIRSVLSDDVPCAFVSKKSFLTFSNSSSLSSLGYRFEKEVYIPQQSFRLPSSKRQTQKSKTDSDATVSHQNGNERQSVSSDCVITFVRTARL